MLKINYAQCEVYLCTFQLHVSEATMTIKFPCTFFIELKSMNSKIMLAMTKKKVSALNSIATFDETLNFETQLLFNTRTKQFMKKQILLFLNLVSNRRADQQKLVGRIMIDLAEIINSNFYQSLRPYKLEYCSVNAHVMFTSKLLGKKISSTIPENFDRDSFSDYHSFITGLHNTSRQIKRNYLQQQEKTLELHKLGGNSESEERQNLRSDQYLMNSNATEKYKSHDHSGYLGRNISQSLEKDPKEKSYEAYEPILEQKNSHHIKIHDNSISGEGNKILRNYTNKSFENLNITEGLNSPKANGLEAHTQYEEILRNSHHEQKRIWQQEKRVLHEQIERQKMDNIRYRQRNDILEKKIYEIELKLGNSEGKIENSKREMNIMEREKDLEIKELNNKLQRAQKLLKEKAEALSHIELQSLTKHNQINHDHQLNLKKLEQDLWAKNQQIQAQNYEYQHKTEQLQNQINQLMQENKNIGELTEKQITQLSEKISKLELQKSQACDNYKNLQQKYSQMAEYSNQNLNLKEAKKVSMMIHQYQPDFQINGARSEDGMPKLESLKKTLEEEKANHLASISTLQNEVGTLTSKISELESKANLLQTKNAQHESLIAHQEKAIQAQNQQNTGIKHKMEKSQAYYAEYIKNLEQELLKINEIMQTENKQKEQSIESMKQSINEMKAYERGLEEELLRVNQTEKKPQGSYVQLIEQEREKSKEAEAYFKQKIRQLENILKQKCIEIQHIDGDRVKTTEIINNKDKQLELLKKTTITLEERLKALTEGAEKTQGQQYLDLQNVLNQKQMELDEEKLKNIEEREQKLKLQQQIQSVNEAKMKAIEQKQMENKLNTEILLATQKQYENLKAKYQRLEQTVKEKEQAIQEKNKEIIRLKLNPSKSSDSIKNQTSSSGLNEEIEKYRKQNEYLNEQLAQGQQELTEKQLSLQQQKQYSVGLEQHILQNQQKIRLLQKQLSSRLETNRTAKTQTENKVIVDTSNHPEMSKQATNIAHHNSGNTQLIQKIQLLTQQNEHNQRVIQQNNTEIKQLKQALEPNHPATDNEEINNLMSELQTKNNYITELESDIYLKHENIGHLENKIKELQAIIEQLPSLPKQTTTPNYKYTENDVEAFKDEIKFLETELSSRDALVEELGSLVNSQKKEVENLENQIENNIALGQHQQLEQANRKINQLETHIQILQAQKTNIVEEKDHLTKSLRENIEKLQAQQALVNEKEQQKKSLQQQIQAMKANSQGQVVELAQKQQLQAQQINILVQQKNKLNEEVGQLRQQNQRVGQQITKIGLQCQNKQGQIQSLSEIKQQQTEQINGLQQSLQQQKQQHSKQIKQIGQNSQKQINQLKESSRLQIRQLAETISRMNQQISQLQTEKASFEEQLLKSEEDHYIETENLHRQSKAKINSIEQKYIGEAQRAKNQVNRAQQSLQEKQAEILKLEQSISTLNSKIGSIQQEKQQTGDSLSQQNIELRETIKRLEFEKTNANSEISTLSTTLRQLQESISEYEQRILTMKQKQLSMEDTINIIQQQSNKIISEVISKEQQIQLLHTQIQTLKLNYDQQSVKEREAYEQEFKNLSNLVDDLRHEIATAEFTFKEQKLKINDRSLEIEQSYKQKISMLQQQLSDTDEQLTINKRLIMKMKDEKQRSVSSDLEINGLKQAIEELEEEIFGYQCSDNEKDLKIVELQAENLKIREILQKIQYPRQINIPKQFDKENNQQQFKKLLTELNRINNKNQKLKSLLEEKELSIKEIEQKIKKERADEILKKKQAKQETEKLKLELAQAKNQLELLKMEIDLIKESKENGKKCSEQSLLDKELYDLKKQMNSLTSKLVTALKAKEDTELKLTKLQKGSSRQQPKPNTSDNELAFIKQSYELLATENAELQREVKDLKVEKEKMMIEFELMENRGHSNNKYHSAQIGSNEIIPAAKKIQELIQKRSDQQLNQKQRDFMISRIGQLETQLQESLQTMKQRSLILEKSRTLSMELSKLKTKVMKLKVAYQERSQILEGLKPFDKMIKEIIESAEYFNDRND